MPPSILKTTSGGTLDDQAVNPTEQEEEESKQVNHSGCFLRIWSACCAPMSLNKTVTAGKVSAMAPLTSLDLTRSESRSLSR
jgi:hypothetical protein